MSVKDLLPNLGGKEMQFAPVPDDDDELSQSIKDDPVTHDNNWELKEDINPQQLQDFWADAAGQPEGPNSDS